MEKEIITLKPNKDFHKFLPMTSSFVDEFEPEQIPLEIRPTFKLKPLSIKAKREWAKVQTALSMMSEKMIRKAVDNNIDDKSVEEIIDSLDTFNEVEKLNNKMLEIILPFVKKWKGFKDIDGNDFEYEVDSEDVLKLDCFLMIPTPIQELIIARLAEISNLNESEKLGLK